MFRTFLLSHFWLEKPLSALQVRTFPWSSALALSLAENSVLKVRSLFLDTSVLDDINDSSFEVIEPVMDLSRGSLTSDVVVNSIRAAGFELSTTQLRSSSSPSLIVTVLSMISRALLAVVPLKESVLVANRLLVRRFFIGLMFNVSPFINAI